MTAEPGSIGASDEYSIFDILVAALKKARQETNRRYRESAGEDPLHRYRSPRDIGNTCRGNFEACLRQYTTGVEGIKIEIVKNTFVVTINGSAMAFLRKLKHPDQKFSTPRTIRRITVIHDNKYNQDPLPGIDNEQDEDRDPPHVYVMGYTVEAGLVVGFFVRDQQAGVEAEYHEISVTDEPVVFPVDKEATETFISNKQDVPEPRIVPRSSRKGDQRKVGD